MHAFMGSKVSSTIDQDIEIEWKNFKLKYNRIYNEIEENEKRKQIYIESKKFIEEHNKRYAKGLVSYTLGINQFADLTDREYVGASSDENEPSLKNRRLNILLQLFSNTTTDQLKALNRKSLKYEFTDNQNLPDNVNWTDLGYDNPILDQGNCGTCYIFGSLAVIEAHYYIKYNSLLQLSHQEILDCTMGLGNDGCGGGYIDIVYNHAMFYGVGLADQNRYIGKYSKICKMMEPRIFIKNHLTGQSTNEATLKEVIAVHGPATTPINAGLRTFKFYKSGLYYDRECTDNNKEHIVATVGYGTTENGEDYWLVRNSFGTDWGDNGYMQIARNRDNQCGLASYFVFPQF